MAITHVYFDQNKVLRTKLNPTVSFFMLPLGTLAKFLLPIIIVVRSVVVAVGCVVATVVIVCILVMVEGSIVVVVCSVVVVFGSCIAVVFSENTN